MLSFFKKQKEKFNYANIITKLIIAVSAVSFIETAFSPYKFNTAEYFNSAVKRVMLLGLDPDDGLVVTLVDGRKITIAWENMSTETETSEAMLQRIRNVSIVLKSNAARGLKHFNAMAADRVTMSE